MGARVLASPRWLRRFTRGMQAAILAVLLAGLWTRNASVIINALLAFGVTLLPAVLERDYQLTMAPEVTVWIAGTVLLHAVGMLGPYGAVWWWDHVTHTLSAAVVASVGYAGVRAVDLHSDAIYLPPRFLAVFVLLGTLALGVFWEVIEFLGRAVAESFGFGPILFQYGLEDTLLDLVFDAVGAAVAALFGTQALSGFTDDLVERLRAAGE